MAQRHRHVPARIVEADPVQFDPWAEYLGRGSTTPVRRHPPARRQDSPVADGGSSSGISSASASVVQDIMRGLALGGATRHVVAAAAAALLRTSMSPPSGGSVAPDEVASKFVSELPMATDRCHDLVARIITAASQCHDALDRHCGVHHHSLAAAVRAASDTKSLPKQLLSRACRVARAADAVRHTTAASLEALVSEVHEAVLRPTEAFVKKDEHSAAEMAIQTEDLSEKDISAASAATLVPGRRTIGVNTSRPRRCSTHVQAGGALLEVLHVEDNAMLGVADVSGGCSEVSFGNLAHEATSTIYPSAVDPEAEDYDLVIDCISEVVRSKSETAGFDFDRLVIGFVPERKHTEVIAYIRGWVVDRDHFRAFVLDVEAAVVGLLDKTGLRHFKFYILRTSSP